MLHYPVTTSFWRGVWNIFQARNTNKPLRRACDWKLVNYKETSLTPTCESCKLYKQRIEQYIPLRYR